MKRHQRIALIAVICAAAAQAFAAITPGEPLPVRILYDNSGSMYPGYSPPGTANRRTRSELGVRLFHEYPQFQQWLADFVDAQTIVGGATVGMWTFTSNQQFTPADIQQVHPSVPVHDFDINQAIAHFPAQAGQNTYLTETLETFTRDFTGLLWLITDNVVETSGGQPDADVQRFFQSLNDRPEYRSVQLYKYTFADDAAGQHAALAVYGILVSAADVPPATLSYYDQKFRTAFRDAKRRQGNPPPDLFSGREHLKLKNLAIDSLELHAALRLLLDDAEKGVFKEGQTVHLGLDGEVKSNLTQHAVTGGRYELAMASPFVPEEWARRDLGASALPPEMFDGALGTIEEPIPPNSTRAVQAQLASSQPVSFSPSGLLQWLRLAWSGATVRYSGTVRMSFTDVKVQFRREQMAGIFGIDRASNVFDFQNVRTLDQVNPSVAQVSFALRTGSSRTAVLLVALAVLAAVAVGAAFVLLRERRFHVRVSGTSEVPVALRRLGTYPVVIDGQTVGRLCRGIGGGYEFKPTTGLAAFSVVPGNAADRWDVKFSGAGTRQLSIVPQDGKRSIATQPAGSPGAPAAPLQKVPKAPPRLPKITAPRH